MSQRERKADNLMQVQGMKKFLTIPLLLAGGLLLAGHGVGAAGTSQETELAMLAGLRKGEWSLKFRDGSMPQKLCVRTGAELLQLRHAGNRCSQYVVEDLAGKVTVQYTCTGSGYGRTSIRRETSSLVQIESQGIAENAPFQFLAEARHTGPC